MTDKAVNGQLPVRWIARAKMLCAALVLASCQSTNLGVDNSNNNQNLTPTLTANPSGEVFGQGSIRVAMLLPKTAPGNGAAVAQEIRNGALLALQDFGQTTIQLVIKDTVGQAAAAQEKATEAVGEGASLIIGPLFSANVSAASAIAQPASRPMIAFSTDASVARRGVYLLSFTPQDDVSRMISYAASQGRRSVVAFLPANAYGSVVEATLRQSAGARGVNIVHVAKYSRSAEGIESAITAAAGFIENADSVYIPEGGGVPSAIVASLARSGVSMNGKAILGSGRWESVKLSDPRLSGAVYTGRDITKFANFSQRYETSYNSKPGVNAALGYDAVTLSVELIRRHQKNAFNPQVIENSNGFAGINGIFRFRNNGTAERGLAIYQATNGEGQLLIPAPTSFGFTR